MTPAQQLIANIGGEISRDVDIANGEDHHAQEQRWWPDRVERQAEVFRGIIERHKPRRMWADGVADHELECVACTTGGYLRSPMTWPCPEIKGLAAIYDFEVPT